MWMGLAVVFGILAAFALALFLVSHWTKKSNDAGDSTGTFEDFSRYDLFVMAKFDNVSKGKYEKMINSHWAEAGNTRWVPKKNKE